MKIDTTMAKFPGLSKRQNSSFYQLCTVIPLDVRAAYAGKATTRKSLGTANRREAELLAARERTRLLEEFETKRLTLFPQRLETITPEMSAELALRVRTMVLSRDETLRDDPEARDTLSELHAVVTHSALTIPTNVPMAHTRSRTAFLGLSEDETKVLASLNDLMSADAGIKLASRNLQSILPLVREEAHKLGLAFDPQAPGALEALKASLKAYRIARHEATQRDAGDVVDTPALTAAPRTINTARSNTKSLRDVFDRWKLSGDAPRSEDAVAAMDRTLRQFEGQHPKVPLIGVTRDMGDTYRAWLLANCKTPKTARDRLTGIKTLMKYAARTLEWTQRHTWEGLSITAKTTHRRRPIMDTELVTLFTTPLHTSYALPKAIQGGQDAAYWLPLLGAYTGARLGELCQLRAVDIQTVEGIPVMVLTDDGEGQRIKSEAGKRSVPIHSELIRLGFLDYATAIQAKGIDALWPELPIRKDKPSDYFGRWFRDFREPLGLHTPGKPTFHYFRHTVRPLMRRAGFSESTQDKVTGHETQGSVGTVVYDHWTLQEMQAAVEAIKYPALSLLKVYRGNNKKLVI